MGRGSYPRTELRHINVKDSAFLDQAVKENERLDAMEKSLDVPPSKQRNQSEDREVGERSPPILHREDSSPARIVKVPGVGNVDLSKIDSYTVASPGSNPMYDALAEMEMKDPDNNLPNYESFSQREDMKGRSEPEVVHKFLDLKTHVARKAEVEFHTVNRFDLSGVDDPVKALEVFSSQGTVDVFKRVAKELDFKGNYMIIDENGSRGDERVQNLRKSLRNNPGTVAAYVEGSGGHKGTVIINPQKVDDDFIKNGGLHHEVIHADHEARWGDVPSKLGYKDPDSIPTTAEQVFIHLEEASVNIRAHPYVVGMGGDFTKLLLQKYGISGSDIPKGIKKIYKEIGGRLGEIHIPEVAEHIATFRAVKPEISKMYIEYMPKKMRDKALELADNFYISGDPSKDYVQLAIKSLEVMGTKIPSKDFVKRNSQGTSLKKFRSLSLEERLGG